MEFSCLCVVLCKNVFIDVHNKTGLNFLCVRVMQAPY